MPRVWLIGAFLSALFCLIVVATLTATPISAATEVEQQRVVDLTNQARAQHGLPPLAVNVNLTTAAESYAGYMATANFFSHVGLDGSTLASRAEAAGYQSWEFLGENIAAGQRTPEDVVQAWMNSPGHRANILSTEAREIGIGHAYDASATYRDYWTMELGSRFGVVPSAPVATATPNPAPIIPTPWPSPTARSKQPQPTPIVRSGAAPAPESWRVFIPIASWTH